MPRENETGGSPLASSHCCHEAERRILIVADFLAHMWHFNLKMSHSNKQRDKLLAIIRRCGFINSIIVGENDNVIAGHSILSA